MLVISMSSNLPKYVPIFHILPQKAEDYIEKPSQKTKQTQTTKYHVK
jgi:hypothetical protein